MAQQYPSQPYGGQSYPTNTQYGNYGVQQQYPANAQYGNYGTQQQYPQYGGQPAQPNYSYGYPQPNAQGPPPYAAQNYPAYPYDSDGTNSPECIFSSKSIRNGFIRKVYGILSVQIMLTIGIVCVIMFVDPVKQYIFKHPFLLWVAMGLVLGLSLALGCFTTPRRKFPLNFILLGVFTLCEGFLLGVISATKDTQFVLYAALITLAIVIVITIFAFQTKIDFTYLSGGLIIFLVIFMVFGIVAFFMRNRILKLVYCCIGVLLFSVYLLVDTQLMMGGNHQYSISPEDYIFAALNLYVDVVQIFLMVLGIFSNSE